MSLVARTPKGIHRVATKILLWEFVLFSLLPFHCVCTVLDTFVSRSYVFMKTSYLDTLI